MLVKINGKTKDVPVTEVTKDNYIVPANEVRLYHCVIEVRKFNPETGERLSKPVVQKFGKKSFEASVANNLRRQGYTITILHNPNEYEATAKAEAKKAKEDEVKRAVADALAKEREAHKAEIDAAVKEALAKAKESKQDKKA